MLTRARHLGYRFKSHVLRRMDRARFAMPSLSTIERRAVDALEQTGVLVTSLDDLGIVVSTALKEGLDALMREVDARKKSEGQRKLFARVSTPEIIQRYPGVIRLGLDETLLNVAEGYLRMPVRYRGVIARIDDPDGQSGETRCWHIDAEDARILKAIVYCSDVGPEDGPFEYIPRALQPDSSKVRFTDHRVTDEDMASLVAKDRWAACTGPAGTVVLADTCSIWHRGRPPTRNERHALFYAYNGPHPLNPQYCEPMFAVDAFARAQPDLSARQRSRLMLT